MTDINTLNHRYGISGQVVFKEGAGGLVIVEVNNANANATITLQGGHLMSWTPRGSQPVIWLSKAAKIGPGKSIRGGVPVCWPWFGPHPEESSFPAHGFARTALWDVIASEATIGGDTRLVLRLVQNAVSRSRSPYSSQLTMYMTLGKKLGIDLVTRNTGDIPFTIGEALHTYFDVGDAREISIHGLSGCEYIDKVDGGIRKRQTGPVTFSAETDRIYINTTADCLIDDPILGRRIHVSKQGGRSTVVWNPWNEKAAKMGDLGDEGYLRMVCVESANAADNLVAIAPGDGHRLQVSYRIEPLPALHR